MISEWLSLLGASIQRLFPVTRHRSPVTELCSLHSELPNLLLVPAAEEAS